MFPTVIARLIAGESSKAVAVRARGRRPLACEALEGRQLLNGAWSSWQASPGALPSTSATPTPVDVYQVSGQTGVAGMHVGHVRGHAEFLSGGAKGKGFGPNLASLSPQAKTDFQTLKTDTQALQAEIPAALTATLKADQAVVTQAFAALTPAQKKADHVELQNHKPGTGTLPDPTTAMTTMLTKLNVPADQVTTIVADFQNYKTTVSNLDPTLQSKIAADQTAVEKDLGITRPANAPKSMILPMAGGLEFGGPRLLVRGPGGHGPGGPGGTGIF
jgi:hypothetical protein